MTKILLATTLLLSAALVVAQDESPVISSELTLLPASIVLQQDRIALLGDHAVLTKTAARAYAAEQIGSSEQLLVVEDASSGRLGTSDGGIVVMLHSASSLDGLAADYGLTVQHIFTAQPAAVLSPDDIEIADTYVTQLREDDRVVSAELNVNFYQEQAY